MRILKQSHSAKKCLRKGEPLGFYNIQFAAKYQKIERGTIGDSEM